ncbi:hypothetical protein D1AOALGA4SA_7429 [Olavius algarvensis Delta 1 endosymbiont]|nr:hypothetical protein D1AOALGA4SA_7429 [Olavius algarvensis Delta 1 endosymbiont]
MIPLKTWKKMKWCAKPIWVSKTGSILRISDSGLNAKLS